MLKTFLGYMTALVNALKMTYVNIGTVRPARESISRAPEVQPLVSPEFLKKFGHDAAPARSKKGIKKAGKCSNRGTIWCLWVSYRTAGKAYRGYSWSALRWLATPSAAIGHWPLVITLRALGSLSLWTSISKSQLPDCRAFFPAGALQRNG